MREAIFSIIGSLPFDFSGTRILDCFAGSGAMGLESLSRGASQAVFVDSDRAAQVAVIRNIEASRTEDSSIFIQARWPQATSRLPVGEPYDLFFLDPPYEQTTLPLSILKQVATSSQSKPGSLAVWEQAKSTLATWEEKDIHPWELVKIRQWSTRAVAFLRHRPEPPEEPHAT